MNDLAILVIHQFVRVITIDTSLGEEGQVHFHLTIFTIDAPAVLFWGDCAVVESHIHLVCSIDDLVLSMNLEVAILLTADTAGSQYHSVQHISNHVLTNLLLLDSQVTSLVVVGIAVCFWEHTP